MAHLLKRLDEQIQHQNQIFFERLVHLFSKAISAIKLCILDPDFVLKMPKPVVVENFDVKNEFSVIKNPQVLICWYVFKNK